MRHVIVVALIASVAILAWRVLRPVRRAERPPELPVARPAVHLPKDVGLFAGDQACRSCHAEQSRSVSRTHHAATARRVSLEDADMAAAFASDDYLLDPYLRARISPAIEGGTPGIRVRAAGTERFYPAEWVLGASRRGYTFLCRDPEGYLTESRITYYPRNRHWSFTPGQPNEAPVPFPIGRRGVEQSCLPCHSTRVVAVQGRLAEEASILGIGCESCHGPAAAHVQSKQRDSAGPLLLARFREASGSRQVGVCGGCHRPPSGADDGALNQVGLARFQGAALGKSACYQRSEGRLTCTTCHDPHTDVSREAEHYNSVCRSCHGGPSAGAGRTCRLGKTAACISCHMQEQDVGMPDRQSFRLHWIR